MLGPKTMVFNAAGVALFVFLGGYMAHSHFYDEVVTPCSTRYPAGLQFSLDNSQGAPLSAIELQARAGFNEFGLLENASVEKVSGAPFRQNLVVRLAAAGDGRTTGKNGVGFTWPVSEMSSATSACLTYYALVSNEVDLKSPGHLPGLMATGPAPRDSDDDTPTGFKARLAWSQSGDVGVDLELTKRNGNWLPSLSRSSWPKGKWVRIEQEVQFNPAPQKTGAVRVWIDGATDVAASGLLLRASGDVKFSGVSGAIGYSRGVGKPAQVKVSPFVVQWR